LTQYSSVTDRQTDRQMDSRPGHGEDARSILLSRVKTILHSFSKILLKEPLLYIYHIYCVITIKILTA